MHACYVATRARIAVSVPRSADAAAADFIGPLCEAEAAQAMQHVHGGELRSDDDGIEDGTGFRSAIGHGSTSPHAKTMATGLSAAQRQVGFGFGEQAVAADRACRCKHRLQSFRQQRRNIMSQIRTVGRRTVLAAAVLAAPAIARAGLSGASRARRQRL